MRLGLGHWGGAFDVAVAATIGDALSQRPFQQPRLARVLRPPLLSRGRWEELPSSLLLLLRLLPRCQTSLVMLLHTLIIRLLINLPLPINHAL